MKKVIFSNLPELPKQGKNNILAHNFWFVFPKVMKFSAYERYSLPPPSIKISALNMKISSNTYLPKITNKLQGLDNKVRLQIDYLRCYYSEDANTLASTWKIPAIRWRKKQSKLPSMPLISIKNKSHWCLLQGRKIKVVESHYPISIVNL